MSIDEIGTDQSKGEFCSDFKLSKTQAQEYFKQASIISSKILHDEYPYLPCFVKGKCSFNNESCSWEIRAGGTAYIKFKNKTDIYGCKSCPGL